MLRTNKFSFKEAPLRVFIDNFYLPILSKYEYHLLHIVLLGKNETFVKKGKKLRLGDIENFCNYAERLVFKNNKEIMSQYSRNHISLLRCCIVFF